MKRGRRLLLVVIATLFVGAPMALRALPAHASPPPTYAQLPAQAGNYDTEPYIAVDPANAQHIVIGWMRKINEYTSVGNVECWAAASTDGGTTWAESHLTGDTQQTCADVSIAFGPDGTVYAARTAYVGTDVGQVYLHTSTDGGVTWSAPTVVFDAINDAPLTFDRPWVFVDNTTSAYRGRVYVGAMTAFVNYADPHVYLKYSTDNGQTFSAAAQVDDATRPATKTAITTWAVSPSGEVMGVYRSQPSGCKRFCFSAAISRDGGQTFTTEDVLTPNIPASLVDSNESNPWATVAADPTTDGRYTILFPDAGFSGGAEYDIAASTTTDHGTTWSAPVQVNDGAANAGSLQDHPWLQYSATGVLYATWRDRRNSPANNGTQTPADLYASTSSDAGATWAANQRLSPASVPTAAGSLGDDFLAEGVSPDGTAWSAWSALNGSSLKSVWISHWGP